MSIMEKKRLHPSADLTVVRDAIHGDIELGGDFLAVLDHPAVQRLRFVRQLATAYLVYPSAHHSRFEHSLGTYHLAGELCDRIVADKEKARHVRLAALLHDVGHSAFSHLSEPIVKGLAGKNHEQLGLDLIASGEFGEKISDAGFSVSKLCDILRGKDPAGAIVCGDLGVDRIDYLLRDAYFCGVSYSVIDAQRLLQTMKLSGKELVIPIKGLKAAESLLVSRYLMLTTVYLHHAVRIAQEMLRKAISKALEADELEVEDLTSGTDDFLLQSMARGGNLLARRVAQRNLFKRAYSAQMSSDVGQKEGEKLVEDLDEALADELGRENFVISPFQAHSSDISFRVEDGKKTGNLVEYSALARALEAEKVERTLIVATDADNRIKAAKIAQGILST